MKIESAEFVLSAHDRQQLLRDGRPEIAFVGRSNVGKSTMMNRLLARRALARTSRTPGRTRAVNYFLVDRRFYFVDLPGFGYAKAAKSERQDWARLMDVYFRQWQEGSLLIQLVDGKVGATDLDQQAHEYFLGLGIQPLVVATKIDKVPRSRRARALAEIDRSLELSAQPIIPFSAVTGEGQQEIWKAISACLGPSTARPQTTGTT